MDIRIAAERLLRDIKHEFSARFPFLKIEFFRRGKTGENHYAADRLLAETLKVDEAWKTKEPGEIKVEDETKVKELEKSFLEKFGLAIQVFRKSGNLWLETTMTDNWSLKQQNDHGKEISTDKPDVKKANTDFEDYRDQP
jgi:hypothetical protein